MRTFSRLLLFAAFITPAAASDCQEPLVPALAWATAMNNGVTPTDPSTVKTAVVLIKTVSGVDTSTSCAPKLAETLERSLSRQDSWRIVTLTSDARDDVHRYIEKYGASSIDAEVLQGLRIQPPNYIAYVDVAFSNYVTAADSPWILHHAIVESHVVELPTGRKFFPETVRSRPTEPSLSDLHVQTTGSVDPGPEIVIKPAGPDGPPITLPHWCTTLLTEITNRSTGTYCIQRARGRLLTIENSGPGLWPWKIDYSSNGVLHVEDRSIGLENFPQQDICLEPGYRTTIKNIKKCFRGETAPRLLCVAFSAQNDAQFKDHLAFIPSTAGTFDSTLYCANGRQYAFPSR